MEDSRTWVKVDVGYLSNPKVYDLLDDHPRAILLHLACILHSREHLTDGRVRLRQAMHLACAEQCDADILMQIGLLEADGDPRYAWVHDYRKHNQTAEQANALSERGRKAAEARHHSPNPATGTAQRNATSTATRNAEREEKKREEVTTSSTPVDGFDEWWGHYPKKVDKGAARKAFKTAAKKTDLATLIAAADAYAQAADPKFTKNPATWLNAESWANQEAGPRPVAGEGEAWMWG